MDQATLDPEPRRDLMNKCDREIGVENVGGEIGLEQLDFESEAEDPLGSRPALEEAERCWGRGGGRWSCRVVEIRSSSGDANFLAFFGNGLADFDKLEKEEEAKRHESPATKENGRNVSPGGLSTGLGTGAEDVSKGGVILFVRRVGSGFGWGNWRTRGSRSDFSTCLRHCRSCAPHGDLFGPDDTPRCDTQTPEFRRHRLIYVMVLADLLRSLLSACG
ncbi:hypothetical protein ACSQ67_021022 [Phaseolus vulgaris]